MRSGDMKRAYLQKGDVFGPNILCSRSTLNTESEYIHIDYDSTRHVLGTIANLFLYPS
jgi:hypothetical protein